MNKELVLKFKKLTGYNVSDIAKTFGVSRQHMHSSLKNRTLTYKAASAFCLIKLINEKLAEHKRAIWELNQLKGDIEGEVISEIPKEDTTCSES